MDDFEACAVSARELMDRVSALRKTRDRLLEDQCELVTILGHVEARLAGDPRYADIVEWIAGFNDGTMGKS